MKLTQRRTKQQTKRKFDRSSLCLYKELSLRTNILHAPSNYETTPSPQQIAAMNFQVTNFRISNGATSIEWRGLMDLSQIIPTSLAQLVELGNDFVEVYRRTSDTPPIGVGFNRTCIATFSNGLEYMKRCNNYQQLLRRLRNLCRLNDTQLISFDIDTYKWKVKISHFSRLKFSAEGSQFNDENDEAEPEVQDQYDRHQQRPQERKIIESHSQWRKTSQSMQTQDGMSVRLPQQLPFTTKLSINNAKFDQINKHNQKLYKYGYRPPKWMQLRFGGNGHRFSLQRSQLGFRICAFRKTGSRHHSQHSLLRLQNKLNSIPHMLKKSNQLSLKTQHTLTLLHILFDQNIQCTMKNGQLWRPRGGTQGLGLIESLKSWFESRVNEREIKTTDRYLRPLIMRRIDLLCDILEAQNKYQIAEAISKLQDESFRSLFVHSNQFPTQLQQVFSEDMACVQQEDWTVQIAMVIWYCVQTDIKGKILTIANTFSTREANQQQQLRILRLYALKSFNRRAEPDALMYEEESVDDDIVGWMVSNMLHDVDSQLFKPVIVKNRLSREVQNLLSKLDVRSCLNIVIKDSQLLRNQKLRDSILKQVLRRDDGNLLEHEEEPSVIADKIRELSLIVKKQKDSYYYRRHSSLMIAVELRDYKALIQKFLQKQFAVYLNEPEKKQVFSKLAKLEFATNSLGQLFKVYIGLEIGHYSLNEPLLEEVIQAMSTIKPGKKVGLPIISSLVRKIDMNPLHFSVLFKTNQSLYRRTLEVFRRYSDAHALSSIQLLIL